MLQMAKRLNVVSWNIMGQAAKVKRQTIVQYLQEMHLIKEKIHLLHKWCVQAKYHAVNSVYLRGASILLYSSIKVEFPQSEIDTEGQNICLLSKVFGKTLYPL